MFQTSSNEGCAVAFSHQPPRSKHEKKKPGLRPTTTASSKPVRVISPSLRAASHSSQLSLPDVFVIFFLLAGELAAPPPISPSRELPRRLMTTPPAPIFFPHQQPPAPSRPLPSASKAHDRQQPRHETSYLPRSAEIRQDCREGGNEQRTHTCVPATRTHRHFVSPAPEKAE